MNNLRAAVVLFSAVLLTLLNRYFFLPRLGFRWGEVTDLLVTNGTIYTSDDVLPFADSMVIVKGRIIRIGNYSSVKHLTGLNTKTLNLEGKVVLPGFIDSHVHLISGGLQMGRVELRGASKRDFINKIKEALSNMQHGSWLLGGGWNNDLWGGELPMASWIDDITPHNPVWVTRMDGHMGLANSLALKIAGISTSTSDPDGGAVIRKRFGEPTGLLIDSAMKLVLSCIPEVSTVERREALLRASNHALMRGVTTVVDFGRYFPGASPERSWEDLSDVYRWADSLGKMKIRVCLFFPMETWTRLHEFVKQVGHKLSQWIYMGGVKSFADGSLGSNSALFYEIEHAQHLAPGTAAMFGDQKVVASVQPDHLLDDADSARKKLGVDRANGGSYLFHSLLAGNGQLALGSDWPVVDINPLRSIQTAMKRVPPGWENPWISSERISLNDALNGYTISAARACFLDEDVGSLSPGKMADFVVLSVKSWDEFALEASAYIEATYVGGLAAYSRNHEEDI